MHLISVFPAHQFIAVQGANIGDALSFADDLLLDDVYCCKTELHQVDLGLIWLENAFFVAHNSACGTPSNAIHMDSYITFMADDGDTVQALVLVETSQDLKCKNIYLLAQSPFVSNKNYALIQIERADLMKKFARMGCTSFCAGTRITAANGQMIPVETLTVGQMVLTRDNGP